MIPAATLSGGGPVGAGPPRERDGPSMPCYSFRSCCLESVCLESVSSILLFANLLTSTLPSKSGLHPFFFTGLQVKGVALDLFDNVFLLHFALEAAQSVFEGFTLLQSNFCQTDTPPNPSGRTE
jgi:hypothetical protein